jgi:antitoxin (DNA-binding transcriptional repressor) of toxin-antitoxin stability system
VARTGQAVLVTKRGVPIVRIVPVEAGEGMLTTEQQAILDRLLGRKLPLAPWTFDRDAIYDD